jgi:hypothetical protein
MIAMSAVPLQKAVGITAGKTCLASLIIEQYLK